MFRATGIYAAFDSGWPNYSGTVTSNRATTSGAGCSLVAVKVIGFAGPDLIKVGFVYSGHDFQAIAEPVTHMEALISFKGFALRPGEFVAHGVNASSERSHS